MFAIMIALLAFASCSAVEKPVEAITPESDAVKAYREGWAHLELPKERTLVPADGAPLQIDDFCVVDVHGKECYFPGASMDDVRFQLGPPIRSEPYSPSAYNKYLMLPLDDEERQWELNEFYYQYDGLYCEFGLKYGDVYLFFITGTRFSTLRGLGIGDSLDKAIRLYGKPDIETFPQRKECFTWLPVGYIYPYRLLTYDVPDDQISPEYRYFRFGPTYHFFFDEHDRVEFIYATGQE